MTDQYTTLADLASSEYKEKGSRFLTFAYSVANPDEIRERLDALRKQHPKANHHCYAWRLGNDGNQYRANDDGEPNNTAGKPILGQIDSFGLSNVLVVVVRYFGGTKLGASGLIAAYRTGAAETLGKAAFVRKRFTNLVDAECSYTLFGKLQRIVEAAEAKIIAQKFDTTIHVTLSVPCDSIPALTEALEQAGVELPNYTQTQ